MRIIKIDVIQEKSNFWNLNIIETCMCFTRFYIKGEHHANRC